MAIRGILNIVRLTPQIEAEIQRQVYFKSRSQIIEASRNIVRGRLQDHPTYKSISAGQLNGQFGFYPGEGNSRISAIATKLVETIDIKLIKVKTRIDIEAFIDYATLYAMQEAKVINDSINARKGKTENILDWLEWMLESGGKVIIANYHVDLKDYSNKPYSRSGEAVMGKTGQFPDTSMPQDIIGTISNNWITESFDEAEKKIRVIVNQILIATTKLVRMSL